MYAVQLSAWSFPLDFRSDEQTYKQSLAELPELAQAAAALGLDRTATWIMPGSAELSYNRQLHRSMLNAYVPLPPY